MKPRLLDLFSGIGGFSLAFERVGFKTVAFSEIEPFPCRVLEHHWPDVPNLGDIRNIDGETLRGQVEIVSFGSPCQDLSVAGKRGGLKGDRSSLFHEAIRVIAGARPAFALWENVPGAYSSNGGWDFAAVLDAMADVGALDIAWTTLDAQYFGVPQRRRRIFLVADFRGERAGEILFESQGLQANSPPSREAGEEVANPLGGGSGARGWMNDLDHATYVPELSHALSTRYGKGVNTTADDGAVIPTGFYANAGYKEDPVSGASTPLNGGRENAGQAAVAFDTTQITHPANRSKFEVGRPCHSLSSEAHAPAVALSQPMAVRRLTPKECERLQGYPDDFTNIPGGSDSSRYRALGNSVAVPVVYWIAQRISQVLSQEKAV